MDTYGVDLMGRRRRRHHSAQFKTAVISERMRPGVSVAAVALARGLNANMLRKWVIDAEHAAPLRTVAKAAAPAFEAKLPGATFIPLALTAPAVGGDIRIEVHRAGSMAVCKTGP